MKQQFIEKDFRKGSLDIIQTADDICLEYASEGYDLSLRQLYYQFVARGLLENTEANYKRLGNIISQARLAGMLDWDYIKDRGRKIEREPQWGSPEEILRVAAKQFRIDRWEDQDVFVMVMVEKQALEGILLPVCKRLDIGFVANKGYSSSSMMYEIGDILAGMQDQNRDSHIIYLGDHDPSGLDMSRDVEDRLEMFSETIVEVHRVALNMDQVIKFNPPENPTKLSDSRAEAYILEHGESSWELDALEPKILIKLIEDTVDDLIDWDKYNAKRDKEKAWKRDIMRFAKSYREGGNNG